MATRKSDSGTARPSFESSARQGGYRSQGPVDTSAISKREGVEDDGFDYEAAARKAEESDNSDGYKYQVAVERARQIAGDDVSDEDMRDLVDAEFAKLSPTATGAQMRGEDNAAAQAIGGFNQAIDNVTGLVGDGINGLWDYGVGGIAGGLAGLAGFLTGNQDEDWGQKAFDAVGGVVGEDGYIDGQDIASIGLDVLLGSVPGVGVPLVVGKNLAQNADNIREAVTGYDSVTGEELSGDARLANGLAAVANVGLSALPGIGRARNLAAADDVLGAADDLAGIASRAAEARPAPLLSALRPSSLARQAAGNADDAASAIGSVGQAISGARGPLSRLRAAVTPAQPSVRNAVADVIGTSARGGAKRAAASRLAGKAAEGVGEQAAKSLGRRAVEAAGRGIRSGAQGVAGMGAVPLAASGSGILNMAAAQDRGIGDVAGDYIDSVLQGGEMNGPLVQSILPVGVNLLTRGRARSMPGVTGRINPNVAPALRYAQVANAGRASGEAAQRMRGDGMSNDEIEEYLAMIGGDRDADAE